MPAHRCGIAVVSRDSGRQILRDGVSWQAGRTWKASADPHSLAKMHRMLDLCDHLPTDELVICADEFGPLNRQQRPRRACVWGHPARVGPMIAACAQPERDFALAVGPGPD